MRPWVLVGTLALATHCGGDLGHGESASSSEASSASSSGSGGGAASSSSTSTSSGMEMVPQNPMFETDIIPILESSCGASDKDCHRREAYGASVADDCRGWSSFENAALGDVYYGGTAQGQSTGCPAMGLYDRLTTLPGWTCGPPFSGGETTYLVVPCDPDASLMMQKIDKPEQEQCLDGNGERTQVMPVGAEMDPIQYQTLRKWIQNGAPTLDNPNPDCSG